MIQSLQPRQSKFYTFIHHRTCFFLGNLFFFLKMPGYVEDKNDFIGFVTVTFPLDVYNQAFYAGQTAGGNIIYNNFSDIQDNIRISNEKGESSAIKAIL